MIIITRPIRGKIKNNITHPPLHSPDKKKKVHSPQYSSTSYIFILVAIKVKAQRRHQRRLLHATPTVRGRLVYGPFNMPRATQIFIFPEVITPTPYPALHFLRKSSPPAFPPLLVRRITEARDGEFKKIKLIRL